MKLRVIITLLLFALIVFFNMAILQPTVSGRNTEALMVPDILFGYSGEALYTDFFMQLPYDQIPTYQHMLYWDFLYPIIYSSFLFLIGQLLFTRSLFSKIYFGAVIFTFILDYAENLTILYLLNELPLIHISVGNLLGGFTMAKWILVIFTILTSLFVLLSLGFRRTFSKTK